MGTVTGSSLGSEEGIGFSSDCPARQDRGWEAYMRSFFVVVGLPPVGDNPF